MKTNRRSISSYLPIVLIATALLTLLVVLTGILPAFRPVLVIAFLFLAPGLAFVRLLPSDDIFTRITLSVALSLGIDAVIAMIVLYTHAWSLRNILLIIAAITLIGSIFQVRRMSQDEPVQEEHL